MPNKFDEVVFSSEADANLVLEAMVANIKRYGICTVGDFFRLGGLDATYKDAMVGWVDLSTVRPVPILDEFKLNLPEPQAF